MKLQLIRIAVTTGALVGALSLTGCATNSEGDIAPTNTVAVGQDSALAASVPSELKNRGVIKIGISPGSPPDEFKDSSGKIVGLDVDLFSAVADKFGLKTEYVESTFDNIIPGVTAGKYDIGVSSFTDTFEREKTVDFVTYLNAGSQWGTLADGTFDPTNACGFSVAVLSGAFQDLETLPAKSAECVASGKQPIDIQAFDTQDQTVTAVRLGKVQAVIADSPAIAYAVKQSNGVLKLSGALEDSAPFGYVLPKGSELTPVIQKGLQRLIDDGAYQKILDSWGLGDGVLTESKTNGAVF